MRTVHLIFDAVLESWWTFLYLPTVIIVMNIDYSLLNVNYSLYS